jgi:hypothetical protein
MLLAQLPRHQCLIPSGKAGRHLGLNHFTEPFTRTRLVLLKHMYSMRSILIFILESVVFFVFVVKIKRHSYYNETWIG